MWPINNTSEESLWKGVGDFIRCALKCPEEEISQADIVSVKAIPDQPFQTGNINLEALVTSACPKKRDHLMASSAILATFSDGSGKLTAGLRLEISSELEDTFKLLARFGPRLTARQVPGTKRHIKFNNINASVYCNIKLPGDDAWSRVTPESRPTTRIGIRSHRHCAEVG